MHHNKKKSAVNKFSPIVGTEGIDAAKKGLAGEGFTEEEVNEIIEAIISPLSAKETTNTSAPPAAENKSTKEDYEMWKVEYVPETGTFDKVKHIKDVRVEPYRAEMFNEQARNSRELLFKK